MSTQFPNGTKSPLARSVSAEFRAIMGVRRLHIRPVAHGAGWTHHNYFAERLRDEKPFTLDDVVRICAFLGEDPEELLQRAQDNHLERLTMEAFDAQRAAEKAAAIETRTESDDRDEVQSAVAELRRGRRVARTREEMRQMDTQAARDKGTGA